MRSSNGMGTITKRKGVNKPYLVYGTAVNVDGVMKRPYLGSYRTRKEAEQRRIDYYINPNITRTELTFTQVYEEYKKTLKYTRLSKSTQDNYKAAYKHCSKLYGIKFCNLRTSHMQEIINQMYDQKMSESSLKKVTILFSVLYGYALENDIVNKNYSKFVILPEMERTEKRALTDDEIKVIKKAAQNDNKAAQWTLYLIYSGWRISEMLELTQSSYDSEEKVFTGGKKTKNGKNRAVPVHPDIQWIVDKQLEENGDTVFCMKNGKAMTSDYFRKHFFENMLEDLKLDTDLTPHVTRHSFATILKRNGADPFFTRCLLGHSHKDITDKVYTHEDLDGLKRTIELLKTP